MIDLPTDLLAAHLPNQRWFAGDKPPARVDIASAPDLAGRKPLA